ncbi:thiolase family protein [Nocardia sp. ET3-3]|uniref:Thiolase family protein n=1 Tax=Nocardia terrae TaxID=2675851 RepID=A0A7K1V2H9_9NOCA|nr:thiolase family protein [Nocardia terrae]
MTTSRASIAGLGITDVGKVYGRSATDFAADAVRRAAADAGLAVSDLDGLLVSGGLKRDVTITLANVLGLRDLHLLTEMNAFGATAGAMVSYAAAAVTSGMATAVACVFADAPLKPKESAGKAYTGRSRKPITGLASYSIASGITNANAKYALATRRHMETYGTTSEQLAHIAVAQRSWAAMNPLAQLRDPITIADHQNSRWIAEPLHLLDCCLVSNGGAAVIVTTADRARDLAQPPVDILGWGQGHPGQVAERGSAFGLRTGAAISGPIAMKMAGIIPADVDVVQLYDCYTFTVLITLEDYGFCAKGEGGAFVSDGKLGPAGNFPLNTGGGQLSSYYLWGMTPLSEAVIQARGQAGDRQVTDRGITLVSGNGGVLDHHSTLVLGGA